jgi:thiol-disulfide isomerase/thioredoxin
MQRAIAGLIMAALTTSTLAADDKPSKATEAYQALEKEFRQKLQEAKTQEEFKQQLDQYGLRFLEFAEKNAKDPSAFDALVYCLRMSQGVVTKDNPAGKALVILERDHVKSARIGELLKMLGEIGEDTSAGLLKAVMEKHPDKKTQAKACKALADSRPKLVRIAEQIKDNEQLREIVAKQRGKDYVTNLLANVDMYRKESEELKKLLEDKFAGLIPDLSIGKPVPEVESVDLDGKKVRLSDLKGKVVVLDIWATWCGPCRAMIPHERELVKRLVGKPFVLVSISADDQKQTVTEFLKKEPMPWTHWWNGAIIEDWNVEYFPTIYVLDAKGVIRYKDVRGEEMDKAVDTLLKEMEGAAKKDPN